MVVKVTLATLIVSAMGILTFLFVQQGAEIKRLQSEISEHIEQKERVNTTEQPIQISEEKLHVERSSSLIGMIKQSHIQHQPSSIAPAHASPPSNAALVSERLIYGSLDAQYTISSFADIECPICKKMHPHIKAVVDYAPQVVNWEYKHYPLSQHNPASAVQSAMVHCALEEKGNRFAWFLLDELVRHTGSKGKGQGDYAAFSAHVGLESTWLEECVANTNHQNAVLANYEEGLSLNIRQTPVLFLKDNATGKSIKLTGFNSAEEIAKSLSLLR